MRRPRLSLSTDAVAADDVHVVDACALGLLLGRVKLRRVRRSAIGRSAPFSMVFVAQNCSVSDAIGLIRQNAEMGLEIRGKVVTTPCPTTHTHWASTQCRGVFVYPVAQRGN